MQITIFVFLMNYHSMDRTQCILFPLFLQREQGVVNQKSMAGRMEHALHIAPIITVTFKVNVFISIDSVAPKTCDVVIMQILGIYVEIINVWKLFSLHWSAGQVQENRGVQFPTQGNSLIEDIIRHFTHIGIRTLLGDISLNVLNLSI